MENSQQHDAFAALGCLWFAHTTAALRPYSIGRHTTKVLRIWVLIRPSTLLPGMLEGIKHILRERTVFGAIVLDLFAIILGGATALMPIYAKEILHVDPIGLGLLKAAPYVGATIFQ